jgi:hypothetical protein
MTTILALGITISSDSSKTDLRSLHDWLADAEELRGAVRLVAGESEPGSLGWTELLAVAVGSGGAVSALLPLLTSWLGNRTYDVRVQIRDAGGNVIAELDASRVRDPQLLRDVAEKLGGAAEASGRPPAPSRE